MWVGEKSKACRAEIPPTTKPTNHNFNTTFDNLLRTGNKASDFGLQESENFGRDCGVLQFVNFV